MQEFFHNEEQEFHGNFCHDEWDKSYDKVIGWLRSHDKRVLARVVEMVEELRVKNKEPKPADYIEEVDERAYDAACRTIISLLQGE